MATVFRGFDERLKVPRAVKILSPELARRRKVLARFEAEAQTMALLDHPHIVRVFDVGVDRSGDGDRAFIVMELVEGGSLADQVAQDGPLPPVEALDRVAAVLDALGYAHQQGVIHRDIKPHNILLTTSGVAKVTDFGIARLAADDSGHHLTRTGAVMGTLGYMGPEQRSNAKEVGPTADIYAVGATLYNLLTARVPGELFASELDPAMLEGIAPEVADLLRKATRYKAEERFQTAAEMFEAATALRNRLDPEGAVVAVGVTAARPRPAGAARSVTNPTFDAASLDQDPLPPPPRPSTASTTIPERTLVGWLAAVAGVAVVGALVLGAGIGAAVILAGALFRADGPPNIPPPLEPVAAPAEVAASPPPPAPVAAPTQAAEPSPTSPAPSPTAARSATASSPPAEEPALAVAERADEPEAAPPAADPPAGPEPAAIQHVPVASTSGSLTVSARVVGTEDHDSVTLFYRAAGTSVWQRESMFKAGSTWTGTVPLDDSFADGAEYFVEAASSRPGVAKLRHGSAFRPHRVAVR